MDWRKQQVEVYRREQASLKLVATLFNGDELNSPILPDFTCAILRRATPTHPYLRNTSSQNCRNFLLLAKLLLIVRCLREATRRSHNYLLKQISKRCLTTS